MATTVQTRTFTDLVRGQVAAIQGAASGLVDFTVGSILRAVVEANAQVVLWLQGLALLILATTRASSSSGSDLDTWMDDYGLTRLPAVAASGQVTFARFTSTQSAVVPVGATVETSDGSQQYVVTVDTSNTLYDATQGGYVLAAGVASATVPIQASTAGLAANAAVGTINTITQALSGIDTVTNALAFTNGADAESDAAFRTRFIAYIASLSKGTADAIGYALTSLGQNVSYELVENQTYASVAKEGHFYVVVDDGTGTPSSSFMDQVWAAVDAVRPVTSTFSVHPPTLVSTTVSMSVALKSGYTAATVEAAVSSAISTYIDGLGLGAGLPYSRIAQIAYDASPGVANVTGVVLGGGTADLAANPRQVIKAGSVQVSAA